MTGEDERDEGIQRALNGMPLDWYDAARECAEKVCFVNAKFTTDAIWLQLEEMSVAPPPERRAMAGVVGWLVRTQRAFRADSFSESERAIAHKNPKRVYVSNLYDPSTAVVSVTA